MARVAAGFQAVYLCAAAFACLAIPLWVALLLGQITLNSAMAPVLWHAHEMLFGFAVAVYLIVYAPWLVKTRADGRDG